METSTLNIPLGYFFHKHDKNFRINPGEVIDVDGEKRVVTLIEYDNVNGIIGLQHVSVKDFVENTYHVYDNIAKDDVSVKDFIKIRVEDYVDRRGTVLRMGVDLAKFNHIQLTPNKYQELAMRTAKPECRNLSNVGLGLAGEAGECADLIKKHLHQQHPLDKEKLKKELGDVAWYLALGCEVAETTLEEVMRMNIDKLMARYPDGFDPEKSLHRAENDV